MGVKSVIKKCMICKDHNASEIRRYPGFDLRLCTSCMAKIDEIKKRPDRPNGRPVKVREGMINQ